MDVNMPVMDGIEATTKIREVIKTNLLFDVYIIQVTAFSETIDIFKCLNAGANIYLEKPIS